VTGHNWNRNYIDIVKTGKLDLDSFAKENIDKDIKEVVESFKKLISESLDQYVQKLTEQNRLQDNNKINLILQKLAIKSDGILDLHTGPTATRYLL
jgi:5-methylcytosine-specific restriction endonuclease McrBC GTP-binding regulatory subunit McrB